MTVAGASSVCIFAMDPTFFFMLWNVYQINIGGAQRKPNADAAALTALLGSALCTGQLIFAAASLRL
jgi:hypothetical protein